MHGREKKQESANQAAVNQSIAEVKTPSPFEQWQQAQTQKWMNFNDGTGEYAGKPKNIMDAPGFSDVADVYGTSRTATENDRHGGGALNLASPSSGAYASQQKQLNDFNFNNNRAEGISNAVAANKASALGQIGTLINLDANRKNTVAGLNMQNQQNYYNRPRSTPWWQTAAQLAIGGAGAASGLGFRFGGGGGGAAGRQG